MSTLFLQVLGVFLLVCVTFSSSKSSKSLATYRRDRRDWSLQGLFQNLLDSIDGDLATTEDPSNITAPAQSSVNSTTSTTPPMTLSSTSPMTLSSTSPMTLSSTSPMTLSSTSPTTLSSSNTTTHVNSTSNSTTTKSSASTISSTTPWITTTEDPRCRSDQTLDTVCTVPDTLIGEDFWDVYYVMFSDDVIRALLLSCSSGHWCLKDKLDFWDALMMERADMVSNSKMFKAVCAIDSLTCLHDFIGNFTECDIYHRMQMILQSINLLCQLKQEVTTTTECLEHVIAALHVTIVDVIRDQNQKEYDEDEEDDDDRCESPESQITRTFLCLEHKCPSSIPVLTSFEPWKWFIGDISTISEKCGYRNDVCNDDTKFRDSTGAQSSITSSASTGAWMDPGHVKGAEPFDQDEDGSALEHTQEDGIAWEYAYDANMLLGMAVTSMILLSVMVIGFFCWWRKLHRDRVVKAGYTQLRCDEA